MHALEIAYARQIKRRKLYVRLFWVFFVAAWTCFILAFVLDLDFGTYGWALMTLAFACEGRQQSAKGWLTGVDILAAAVRSGAAVIMSSEEEDIDPSQVVQSNGATEGMNWRAHA